MSDLSELPKLPERTPLVLHVTNRPTPYRLPYLRAVHTALADAGVRFHVFFLGKGKRDRDWEIAPEDLHGFESTLNTAGSAIGAAIEAIGRLRPALVVLAWAMDPEALRLLLHCMRIHVPTILFTGETAGAAAGRSYPWLRSLVRRPFFWCADGFLTYGQRSTEYLRDYGVAREKITTGINVVDTEYFRASVDACRADGSATAMRARHVRADGTPFTCHLLLVGYMIPGKGISATLRALAALGREDIALHLVGAGAREPAHRARVAEYGLVDRVFFHGYQQIDAMPSYYAFADVALFPSSIDVFGLVMVEAAAAALPIIASARSGGTVDVVVDGVTGIVVDPHDTARYAAAIARLADDAGLRATMGAAARERATTALTLERSAGCYVEAVRRGLWMR